MSRGDAALLIDFGSTFTKLRAVDLDTAGIVGSGQAPSTVSTDVTLGLEAALRKLADHMGSLPRFRHRLASSSAAGGLRMVTVGLVRELTAEAARIAALGAGAKLIASFAYRLTAADLAAIEALAPDVLLLAGGTDGGNSEVILHNAHLLAQGRLDCPVVAAGNRETADVIRTLFEAANKTLHVAGNVMPSFNELDIEPARKAIRAIFIERIVHAKGIDSAAGMFDAVLMPTPAAVMDGAQLLSEGTSKTPGLGPLLVVDVGGATTDVHSIASGEPVREDVVRHGLPEPHVKRTVEGDLGMRHNVEAVVEAAGIDSLAQAIGRDIPATTAQLERIARDTEWLPESEHDFELERLLAGVAVGIAVKRHCGTTRVVYTASGPATIQEGRDLSAVGTIIGTGGALVHAPRPRQILSAALADPAEPESLRPTAPALLLDDQYVLYAVGLLAAVEPEAALTLGLRGMQRLREDSGNAHRRTG